MEGNRIDDFVETTKDTIKNFKETIKAENDNIDANIAEWVHEVKTSDTYNGIKAEVKGVFANASRFIFAGADRVREKMNEKDHFEE